jgi:CubicO group peptidase (beta-lactamase class C family)
MLVAQPMAAFPGRRVVYSDLGYMVLAWMAERVSGMPMEVLLRNAVYPPLSVDSLYFLDPDAPLTGDAVAATEYCPWRNVLLSGRVHDDNADVCGGVEGHAGLFGTTGGIHQLLCRLLAFYHDDVPDGVFRGDLVRLFLSPWGKTGRTPGFDRPDGEMSSAGKYFSKNTVGHLGFTGTSFWMDLDRRVMVVLLTNRVHPSRNNLKIKSFRPLLHDIVMEAVFRGKGT